MKNLLLIPIAFAMLSMQKPGHNISGRFEKLCNDTVIVQSCDVSNILRVRINPDLYLRQDTLVVHNGRLDIDWSVERPTYFTIRPLQTHTKIQGGIRWFQDISNINFFLNKGERVAFTVSATDSVTMNYTLAGSALNKNWSVLRAQTLPYHTESTRLSVAGDHVSHQEAVLLQSGVADAQREIQTILTKYIRKNPGDPLSGFLLSKLPLDSAAVYLGIITPEVRTSAFEPLIDHITTRIEVQQVRKLAIQQIKEGAEAPDFTLRTIDGKDFTLSSLRGKYVVLDFWGSWCGWCIKGMPKMKDYYEKYAGKFEVVGIACNDTEQKWQQAVAENSLPWINVINPKNQSADQDLIVRYGIRGFPTMILLGPDGRIVSIAVGESPVFYKKLDELLQ